jgi:hypothetical protein
VDRIHDRRPPRRGERSAREPVRLCPLAGPPRPQLPGQAGPAHREGPEGRRGSRPVPRPVDGRAISRSLPAPPFRSLGSRHPGARGRVCVLSRPGRPRAVEPGHDDASVPPVRPPGRHHQLAKGTPPLLRHSAPGRGHRPEHRRRRPRACRGLDDLEVLHPVHQSRSQDGGGGTAPICRSRPRVSQ